MMNNAYVHGYDPRENMRLQDQASTLVELLHSDTFYPAGSRVLEAGCGILLHLFQGRRCCERHSVKVRHAEKGLDTEGINNAMIQTSNTKREVGDPARPLNTVIIIEET